MLPPDTPQVTHSPPPASICGALGLGQTDWHALGGGRSNRLWRVTAHKTLVVKLYDPAAANPMFPNDPDAEVSALSALARTTLAPSMHVSGETRDGRFIAYEYLEGEPLAQTGPEMVAALGRLHSLTPPAGLRRINDTPATILSEGDAFLDGLLTPLARQLRACRPVAPEVSGGQTVFLHGDPTPANAIATPHGLRFVDRQCPAVGDHIADLAVALSPAMHVAYGRAPLTETATTAALAAYPDPETQARYTQYRAFYGYRMAAYSLWKAAHGASDYLAAAEAELREL